MGTRGQQLRFPSSRSRIAVFAPQRAVVRIVLAKTSESYPLGSIRQVSAANRTSTSSKQDCIRRLPTSTPFVPPRVAHLPLAHRVPSDYIRPYLFIANFICNIVDLNPEISSSPLLLLATTQFCAGAFAVPYGCRLARNMGEIREGEEV